MRAPKWIGCNAPLERERTLQMSPRTKLALLALLVVSSTAVAQDAKRMSANNCLLQRDWMAGTTAYDRGGARIGAHVGGFFGFVCPLLRSNPSSTSGLSALTVNVTKYGAGQLLCYAQSTDMNGSVLKSVSKSIASSERGTLHLVWGSSLNTSSAKGTFAVQCNTNGGVPFGDELYSIEYTEP